MDIIKSKFSVQGREQWKPKTSHFLELWVVRSLKKKGGEGEESSGEGIEKVRNTHVN